jgi:hexulose-6-phosphate isomerase
MKTNCNRRRFLACATTLTAGVSLGLRAATTGAPDAAPAFKTRLRKAVILNPPTEDALQRLKDAGFAGVEAGVLPVREAAQCRIVAERLGLSIHSVLRGWAEFNSPDASKVEAALKLTEDALRAAQAFGADAVLLVPCRIGGMKLPKPHEFALEFDAQTGHLTRVVAGDNAPYADYIQAHNRAGDLSRQAVQRLLPLAERCGVVLALENVWNNLWVKPAHFQQFVASFNSRWVKAYFDIGNHVKYAPPQEWILALGGLIAKCHAKDFQLSATVPGEGRFVNLRDGSVRWPAVRAALDQVGYHGWLTIEGGDLPAQENSRRLDLILAGQ